MQCLDSESDSDSGADYACSDLVSSSDNAHPDGDPGARRDDLQQFVQRRFLGLVAGRFDRFVRLSNVFDRKPGDWNFSERFIERIRLLEESAH